MKPPPAAPPQARGPELTRALGFRDLVLFYVSTSFSLRWVATAAAAGPSALLIWLIAAAGLFVPLVFAVLELSSRYPEEGGLYVWSKRAFGPFGGFMTGWMYWASNLPYYPGLLYFGAANILYAGGPAWQPLSTNSTYFIVVSLAGLVVAVSLNVVGLNVSKWLSNAGAVGLWIPALLLVLLGGVSWWRFGAATPLTVTAWLPATSLKDVIFWSTIAFAFGGLESASFMGEEIENPKRTLPRALLTAGGLMTVFYLVGTLAILLAIPREQISGLQGFMQAIEAMARNVDVRWLVAPIAVLVTLSSLGGVGSWFAATARIPFVAGVDRFLPAVFGRLHPRWKTPYVALLVQGALAAIFVVVGQAGTSVRGAYDVLVSMSIISYFVPFLFMFAALIVIQREPAGSDVFRIAGGAPVARLLGALGFLTTATSIVLACVPPDDEPEPLVAVAKVVGASVALFALGAAIYVIGRRKSPDVAPI